MLVVDNTDRKDLDVAVRQLSGFNVTRLTGWVPGNFFAQETTVAVRVPTA